MAGQHHPGNLCCGGIDSGRMTTGGAAGRIVLVAHVLYGIPMTGIAVDGGSLGSDAVAYVAGVAGSQFADAAAVDVIRVDADRVGHVSAGGGRRVAVALCAAINRSVSLVPRQGGCIAPLAVAVTIDIRTSNGICSRCATKSESGRLGAQHAAAGNGVHFNIDNTVGVHGLVHRVTVGAAKCIVDYGRSILTGGFIGRVVIELDLRYRQTARVTGMGSTQAGQRMTAVAGHASCYPPANRLESRLAV